MEDPALPTIEGGPLQLPIVNTPPRKHRQQVGGTPSGLVQVAPVLHQKNRMMPEIVLFSTDVLQPQAAAGGEQQTQKITRVDRTHPSNNQ